MKKVPPEILEVLEERDNFLITSHYNLEGDAVGSELALDAFLKKKGKKSIILNDDKVPQNLMFLPEIENIKDINDYQANLNFEVAIILDVPHLERIGKMKDIILQANLIINIDHHISNRYFGDLNWVETKASSVGELIYYIYKEKGIEIDSDVACYIYVAIVTDSGGFRYLNTNPNTHYIAGELLQKGIKPYKIYNEIYEGFTIERLKMLGKILYNVKSTEDRSIVWFEIKKETIQEFNLPPSATEGIIDYGRGIKEAKLVILFQEINANLVKVGFRSNDENIDVNKLANYFGGGGHIMASGCRVKGSFEEIKNKVLSSALEFLRKK